MRTGGLGILGLAMVVSAGLAIADPLKDKAKEPAAAPVDPAMEAMMKAGMPGAEHKNLAAFVGDWEGTLKFWTVPGTPPEEQKTACTSKLEFDGRYLYTHWSGDMGGMDFKGVAVCGYNNVLKEYQSTWIDNMSTGISWMTGKYNAAKKQFEWTGDEPDPVTGKKSKVREVQTVGADTFKMEFYKTGDDGKESLSMQIDMKRKAGGTPK
jgi:hypothetical protein